MSGFVETGNGFTLLTTSLRRGNEAPKQDYSKSKTVQRQNIVDTLRKYLEEKGMGPIRGAAYHPRTQGKIERFHRTMKNLILLNHYFLPEELDAELARFIEYYNYHRVRDLLGNETPADVYFGRREKILSEREAIKRQTLARRREYYLRQAEAA